MQMGNQSFTIHDTFSIMDGKRKFISTPYCIITITDIRGNQGSLKSRDDFLHEATRKTFITRQTAGGVIINQCII